MEENKVSKFVEKHKIRIAAGVQLLLCYFSFRWTFKKELRKMKKKCKK